MVQMLRSSHPGRFIKMEILEPLALQVTEAARILGVTRPTLSTLINGRSSLSSDMAIRVEKAFGVRMDTLLRMQTAYDIATARTHKAAIKVKRYRPGKTGEAARLPQ